MPRRSRRCWRSATAGPSAPRSRWISPLVTRIGGGERPTGPRASEVGGDLLQELGLPLRTHDPGDRVPLLEEDEGGDAHDVEPAGDVEVVVDVELGDPQLAGLLGGDLLEHRGDHLAWPAPFGPEVHEHGDVRRLDMLVKGSVAQSGDPIAHVSLLSRRSWPYTGAVVPIGPTAFGGGNVRGESVIPGTALELVAAGRPQPVPVARTAFAACSSRKRSASMAAMQPDPAAVIAWRYWWSCTS